MADILEPACDLARQGFPVAEVTAFQWAKWTKAMRDAGRELGGDFLPNQQPPKHGQVITNPGLAQTFQVTV